MKLKFSPFLFLVIILFSASCNQNKWEVDVSKISINQTINRFDQEMFLSAEDGISEEEANELQNKYPKFYPLFTGAIMGLGDANDSKTLDILNQFVSNKDIQELFEDVSEKFPTNSLEDKFNALQDGFKRFHFYFPQLIVPDLYTMVSAFNYSTVADDSVLAIGLDTYMGGDYEIYPKVGIPKYKFQNFSEDYMVTDALKAWILTEFETEGGQNLLEQMVFHGKCIYLTKALLPNEEQYLFFNYTNEELEWCRENESPIWFHFVDMELLYTNENHQLRKYMGDAPFIAGFPEGSPGRVGQWVGYKIVDSYMKENENLSLTDLMNTDDANLILRKSNYKPKR